MATTVACRMAQALDERGLELRDGQTSLHQRCVTERKAAQSLSILIHSERRLFGKTYTNPGNVAAAEEAVLRCDCQCHQTAVGWAFQDVVNSVVVNV
jgi:hypothetical protein